jgi:hypothetical protein
MSPEKFLQLDYPIDPWYFRVGYNDVRQFDDGHQFYCWKNNFYAGSNFVKWNYMKIPLVSENGTLRKITHREIASLKGFPTSYELPVKDKQWLYKNLMYAGNIFVIKQMTSMISYMLAENPWRSQQIEYSTRFEEILSSYLSRLKDNGVINTETIERGVRVADQTVDFSFQQGDSKLYLEVKYYNSNYALTSKVSAICKRLSAIKAYGVPILAIANEVPDYIKNQCLEQYDVSIWDVGNLLWLFDKFVDIKNKFIATLNYTTEHIEPKSPIPAIFQEFPESKEKEPSLGDRLIQIAPGREQFQEYESLCIEILKYVLGDYLTLWETQQSSNDGLYRFDLCCKIKIGANQDFFDTVKHYFNTKYIVFDFKNYKDKITQKEIYTTEKYLYEKALRKVAIIISRQGADEHALQAARGSLRETGKLILCLSDNDLLEMIGIKTRGEQETAEFLGVILDDLLVHLEK